MLILCLTSGGKSIHSSALTTAVFKHAAKKRDAASKVLPAVRCTNNMVENNIICGIAPDFGTFLVLQVFDTEAHSCCEELNVTVLIVFCIPFVTLRERKLKKNSDVKQRKELQNIRLVLAEKPFRENQIRKIVSFAGLYLTLTEKCRFQTPTTTRECVGSQS